MSKSYKNHILKIAIWHVLLFYEKYWLIFKLMASNMSQKGAKKKPEKVSCTNENRWRNIFEPNRLISTRSVTWLIHTQIVENNVSQHDIVKTRISHHLQGIIWSFKMKTNHWKRTILSQKSLHGIRKTSTNSYLWTPFIMLFPVTG